MPKEIKKCDICGEETKALHLHMRKHQKSGEDIETNKDPDPRYATKEDINRINSSLEKLTGLLTKQNDPTVSDLIPAMSIRQSELEIKNDKLEKNSEKPDQSPIPPKWRAMVDEILGSEFGINVVYPDQGSGFLFKIIVPLDKSNAAKDYLEMHKADIRTKAISYQDGIEGVKRFCELVKKNLITKK